MKKKTLRTFLLIMPLLVLFITLFFLDFSIRLFKDTAYTVVYNTNVESVKRFDRELFALTDQGYTSDMYGNLYTLMIRNYCDTLGEKEAIVTFLMNEEGQIHHSNDYNRTYLSELLKSEDNQKIINNANAAQSIGEIKLDRNGTEEILYYHRFFSGPDYYCLFMGIEKRVVEASLHINGIIIPICIVGVLIIVLMEQILWLKLSPMPSNPTEKANGGNDDAD